MSDPHRVPVDVDAQVPILFWDPPEFIIALLIIGMSVVFKQFLFGLAAGVAVLYFAKKMKEGAKRGQTQHLIWKLGITMDNRLAHFPPPSQIEYME